MADRLTPLRGRLVPIALFITLGLVAAFIVSVVAGRGGTPATAAGTSKGAANLGQVVPAEVRVEVLNGAGRSGLARSVTRSLRREGFDVVFYGNAERTDHPRSVVLDRLNRPDRARAVAAALGIDSIAMAVDSSLMLDVTVLLGRDREPQ